MSGSLIPLRVVVFLLIIIIGVAFWPLQLLTIDKFSYACTNGKSLSVGESMIQLGRLSIHDITYKCPTKEQYNPKNYVPLDKVDPTKLPDLGV